jgi:hypothetical protein
MSASGDERNEPQAGRPADEPFWLVALALVLLGGLVMLWAWLKLPLEGPQWLRTAWPTLWITPLVVLVAMLLLAAIDQTWMRRSVQFALIVGVILHLLLVWYLGETQLSARFWMPTATHRPPLPPRPTTIVPHYLPPQLVPDEDRPRQDFEKPVESQAAEPSQTAVPTARQARETPSSLALPQPVPVPEQLRTPEPNVVRRPALNQAVPRLASQASQLSRSLSSATPPPSLPAEMPAPSPQPPASPSPPQLQPAATADRHFAAETSQVAPLAAVPETMPRVTAEARVRPADAAQASSAPSAPSAAPATPPPARTVAAARPAEAKADLPSVPGNTSASSPPSLQAAAVPEGRSTAPLPSELPSASPDRLAALPARPSATLATSAARRPEAAQSVPSAATGAPQKAAPWATGKAAAEIPSIAFRAEVPSAAGIPPTARPSELTASSGGSLTRADALARSDAVTAPRGLGEVDAGAPQVPMPQTPRSTLPEQQPEKLGPASRATALARRTASHVSDLSPSAAHVELPPVASGTGQAAAAATAELPPASVALNGPSSSDRPTELARSQAPERIASPPLASASEAIGPKGPAALADAPVSPSSAAKAARSLAPPASMSVEALKVPEVGPNSAVAQAESDHRLRAGPTSSLLPARPPSESGALPVPVEAPEGPGGLGARLAPTVGIPVRPAQSESLQIEIRTSRFARSQVGGLPAMSTAAVVPTEAFRGRQARLRGDEAGSGRGSIPPQTEEAIERGLAFLARFQRPDGSWSLQGFPEEASLVTDTAATALAVLAFQGAGYTHREFQYQEVVRRGLDYLVRSQQPSGDLFVPLDDESNRSVWLYSHSLAALALCEAYGMTQDPALRQPAQRAIDFIVASQDPQWGGWRYSPGVGTDTSVTGWMMMALKSGELAGLTVPPASYARIVQWLDLAQQSPEQPHLYRYNPLAPDTPQQRHGRVASRTMTAVGLLMRMYTGWRRDNPHLAKGAAYLAQNLPAIGTVRDPQRDTYYWYYATQVMAHMGGEYWRSWNARLHPLLIDSQVRDGPLAGSWDPRGPVPDRWGPHAGRLYVTTLNLLSLEVQYRKLPLYEDTIR